MVTYTVAPNSSYSYTLDIPNISPPARPRCDTVGKVHHFHREPIECLDTKTVNHEDLCKIDKCCRCGFEQEIQKPDTLNCTMKRPPIPRPVQPTIARAERSEADSLMKVYNEKRKQRIQREALRLAKK